MNAQHPTRAERDQPAALRASEEARAAWWQAQQGCQPKGSMCMSCINGSAACAQLPFDAMPVIKVYPDGVKAVRCSGHQAETPMPRRCIHCRAPAPAHLEEGESPP